MRGADISQPSLFVARTVDDFVPKKHPLRAVRKLIDEALRDMDEVFDKLYSDIGKASIAPERLIRASLLQVLYTIRSERQLVEHIQYNLLYRWFVGLELDDGVWDHSTFSKNRERLLDHRVMATLFESVLKLARRRNLLSTEHFSVDGTLIQAWASHKSFRSKDDENDPSDGQDFRGQRRTNETHASTTDPDAELMRKSSGQESRLSYGVDHLMENRNTLVVRVVTRRAATVHERTGGLMMIEAEAGENRITVGGDCGYDTAGFIEECRGLNVTPHVAQNVNRRGGSALDERTTRHPGYQISLRKRKMIETTFGWAKQYGGLRRMMYRGLERVAARVTFTMAVFNLMRIRNIEMAAQAG
jgi:transposase